MKRDLHLMRAALPSLAAALVLLALVAGTAQAQPGNRIRYNGQDLFLSGGNVAWVNFARDIGPGNTALATFDQIFADVHANGGNAMRLWLHTTGETTPEWDGNRVVGPGAGAIADLRDILDLAWKHEVGLLLCLWSHDMMRLNLDATTLNRAYGLLTDTTLLQTYLDNALVPMVEGLKGHPGIIAWEIFNEPEGFSSEFGWNDRRRVPMSAIQRFVNRAAGAIHRADPDVQVTNGTWRLSKLSDQTPSKTEPAAEPIPSEAVDALVQQLSLKYRRAFSADEVQALYRGLRVAANTNYYRDDRLIMAGGDSDGTLDFYTVHFYQDFGTAESPFQRDYAAWGLDKPLVVAEFFMNPTYGVPYDQLYTTLYNRGYAGALAWQWYNYPNGAEGVVNWPRMLEGMKSIWQRHPEAVDVRPAFGITYLRAEPDSVEPGAPSVLSWAVADAAAVTLDGEAVDSSGTRTVRPTATATYTLAATGRDGQTASASVTVVVTVPEKVNRALGRPAVASSSEFGLGSADPAFAVDGDPATRWSSEWQTGRADTPDDEWIYVDLGAVHQVTDVELLWEAAYGSQYDVDVSEDAQAWTTVHQERAGNGGTDAVAFAAPVAARYVRLHGLRRASQWGFSLWELRVFGAPPPPVRYELEDAALTGQVTVQRGHPAASGGAFLDLRQPGTITLDSVVVDAAGPYTLTFGYNLFYNRPKGQFLDVNGTRVGEVMFDGALGEWLRMPVAVTLQAGVNTVRVEASWGWMYLDYVEVSAGSPVAVEAPDGVPAAYTLAQNYPNPFNPSTVIRYTLPASAVVRLDVFDATGRRVAVLVDGVQPAGEHDVRFDARTLASGLYLYRLQAGSFVQTKRMVLMR